MTPYWNTNFFEFIGLFVQRLFTGRILELASDEIQIGVLVCIAISCSLLGPFLILKKMAMFANSLSHTLLLGVAGVFFLFGTAVLSDVTHLVLGALIAAFLTALCTEVLVHWFRLTEDASIGLIFTSFFALGILLITLFTRDLHLGIESVMGNADLLQKKDLNVSFGLLLLNGSFVLLLYRHFFVSSFDPFFAKMLKLPAKTFHYLLLFLVSMTCIGAFRAVGVLLVLAYLLGPYLTVRLFCHRLQWIIVYSCLLGSVASIFAVATTRHILSLYDLPLSTGAMAVCWIGLFYVVGVWIAAAKKHRAHKKIDGATKIC
jgi:manganese/zinc/iron transport system permease protein